MPEVLPCTRYHRSCRKLRTVILTKSIRYNPHILSESEDVRKTLPTQIVGFWGIGQQVANYRWAREAPGPLGRWQLRSVEVLSNAIEGLKGSPASPGPKRVFRTVVSELARV